MSTTLQAGRVAAPDCELIQFQRRVIRIVADLVVRNGDGENLCKLTSRADYDGKPFVTVENLILGFIEEWKQLHNKLSRLIRGQQFGHIDDSNTVLMEVLVCTGTLLFQKAHQMHCIDHEHKTGQLPDHILDMKAAIQGLRILQLTYDKNPENDVLDSLAMPC